MSILIDKDTKVVVQGMTGRDGSFHAQQMIDYGTNVVAGVTPGKGGTTVLDKPVFNSVNEAVEATGADTSVIFVPAKFSKAAMLESAHSKIKLCITITEGVPTLDALEAYEVFQKNGIRSIGPNCPGLITPGACKIGIMPARIHKPGKIGVISRSGTLTYEIVKVLTDSGLGESTCVGIGGDPIIGSKFIDLLPDFEADEQTEAVVMVGEIGGRDELVAAEYIKNKMKKKVVAFMAGISAPAGKRMGHAGAIVGGEDESAASKIKILESAGIPVAREFEQIVTLLNDQGIK